MGRSLLIRRLLRRLVAVLVGRYGSVAVSIGRCACWLLRVGRCGSVAVRGCLLCVDCCVDGHGIHGRKISIRFRCGYADIRGQDSRISL